VIGEPNHLRRVRHFNIKRSAANLVEHRKCTSYLMDRMHNVPGEMPVTNGIQCCGNGSVQYRGRDCEDRRSWAAFRPAEYMKVCVVISLSQRG
jgi:hypothetical protein